MTASDHPSFGKLFAKTPRVMQGQKVIFKCQRSGFVTFLLTQKSTWLGLHQECFPRKFPKIS